MVNKIRKPVVAGMFYPADKESLSNKIENFLNNVETSKPKPSLQKIPKILIVPHAGYDYSGQVAAYGYKTLENYVATKHALFDFKPFPTVIILASSHNYPINGIITDSNDSWKTPLGKVDLDKELIDKLAIAKNSEPFVPEHSLEVQLPFLQKVLPKGFKIVPILVGDNVGTQHAVFLQKYIDEKTIVIVSSDMSHYPSYNDANEYDHRVINSILTGNVNKFENTISELEQKNIPNAVTFMCAEPAVKLGMILAEKIGAKNIELLKYANSGDVTNDKSKVVGYSAIGFFKNNSTVGTQRVYPPKLQRRRAVFYKKSEQKKLLKIARESVESYIKTGTVPNFNTVGAQRVYPPKLQRRRAMFNEKSGAFVTLTKNGQLRGCIGLMESDQPLYKTVSQMAIAAATQDPRFAPLSPEELSEVNYEISVLSPMRKIKNVKEIKLGKHGVKVQNGCNSGVFLPQVALETGWGLEELMSNLCEGKAGLPRDCWQDPATEIYIFTAQVFSE